MTLIVSAKEQQAAEANKNAAILLEELSLEREREETKRAAAARKRDRKRLKKKERADKDREPDSGYFLVRFTWFCGVYSSKIVRLYTRLL